MHQRVDDGSNKCSGPLLRTSCESMSLTDIITIEAVPMAGNHGRRGYRSDMPPNVFRPLRSEPWIFVNTIRRPIGDLSAGAAFVNGAWRQSSSLGFWRARVALVNGEPLTCPGQQVGHVADGGHRILSWWWCADGLRT